MPPLTYIHAFEAVRTTPGNFELKKRNMTLADHYIAVIKRYRKELLKLSHLIVADAFFSTRTFYASAEWQLISIQVPVQCSYGIFKALQSCIARFKFSIQYLK